ncbi:ATPase V [Burkholderia ubonensis]|uniref:ATPase V n=1 Tax=Burkholderia ubonensis TaxID=101571 RepID=UPI000751E4FF|nr:ATPase V [Burkholderia ubonensis]KVD76197.1 ATPase V [Burkholderia ubonensis]
MHFNVMRDDGACLEVFADSRVIKASAVAELFDAIDLRQRLRAELEQAGVDRATSMEKARREGYAQGEQDAQRAVSERMQDAHRFLARAYTMLEARFAHFIVMAVTRIVASQPEPDKMQMVIQHAYTALGNEIIMRIVVHPENRDAAQVALERYRPEWKALLVEDVSVAYRSCRLESAIAVVEHDWEALIAGIERAAREIANDAVALTKESS